MASAKKIVDEEGVTIIDDRGNEKVNPALTLHGNSLKSALAISRKLGLAQRDAKELGLIESDDSDGLDDND